MAMRKATAQRQVAEAITRTNPADRPIVTLMGLSGPSPLWMLWTTAFWIFFVKTYFVTVTEQAVVFHRASKMSSRPQEIVLVVSHAQAAASISDVHIRKLWSSFRFQMPDRPKPTRINIARAWRPELQHLLNSLTPRPPH